MLGLIIAQMSAPEKALDRRGRPVNKNIFLDKAGEAVYSVSNER